MKKGLLSIAAGLAISLGASAQTYNPDLWLVQDSTKNTLSLTGLTGAAKVEMGGSTSTYATSWNAADELTVNFTNENGDGQYNDFSISFLNWQGGGVDGAETGKHFIVDTAGNAQDHDIARGWSVDFSDPDNASVSFEYKVSEALQLRMDLGDIAGKSSNTASPALDLAQSADWTSIVYSWGGDATADVAVDKITDSYTGDWWEIGSVNDYSASKVSYLRGGVNAEVPMDVTKIIKLAFTIDQAALGTTGDTKTLQIKNIVVGAAPSPSVFVKYNPISVASVEAATLEVVGGVIYSEGSIVVTGVTGVTVLVAEGELSIASLPAGAYVITAPEGALSIVK